MKNIIFIAPPAAGKGTISDYLIKNYHYNHLSTGDLLREEIASGSDFGNEIKEIMAKGDLVSDDVMISLMENKLKNLSNGSFILDGFPRTLNQAKNLNKMLVNLGVTNNIAIYLDIDYDLALKRVLGRVNCPNCGRSYNVYFEDMKSIEDNVCDDCKTELIKRTDDNEESFKVRFDAYLNNARSLLDYYKNMQILKEIKVDNDFNRVLEEVIKEANND
ncbi:MAG: nucleoside monophosphate kinase [Ruminococcus sp.]|nr:nucleoside monophosphate kinase [Ruminococcus sp.]